MRVARITMSLHCAKHVVRGETSPCTHVGVKMHASPARRTTRDGVAPGQAFAPSDNEYYVIGKRVSDAVGRGDWAESVFLAGEPGLCASPELLNHFQKGAQHG